MAKCVRVLSKVIRHGMSLWRNLGDCLRTTRKEKVTTMQKEFYVACSISGTFCFITANKKFEVEKVPGNGEPITLDELQFTASRPRVGTSLRGAIKLLWPELNDPDGSAPTNAAHILAKFHELREAGWQVDDKAFISKHNLGGGATQNVASAPVVSQQSEFGVARLGTAQMAVLRYLRDHGNFPVTVGDLFVDGHVKSMDTLVSLHGRELIVLSEDRKQILELKLPTPAAETPPAESVVKEIPPVADPPSATDIATE
jgi:hypothetical protein